jgi:hypothetical protein
MFNWSYNFENLSLWFQGGVRRGFLVFALIGIVLCFPIFFFTTFISGFVFQASFNPYGLEDTVNYQKKNIPVKEIIFSNSQVVPLKDGSKELYLSINNKANTEIGFYPFIYELIVTDNNGVAIDQSKSETYLLPGEIKYIVYRAKDSRAEKLTIRQNQDSKTVFFNPFSRKYKRPNLATSNARFEERTGTNILNVYFTVRNNDTVNVNEVDLIYTIRDNRESVIGIGDFKLSNLKSGEERDVFIPYTQSANRSPRFINIDWYVNFLQDGVIN